MDIGMLWFDDQSASTSEKIQRAVSFYTEKYGRRPTLCLVNPTTLNGGEGIMAGVKVRKARNVMPDHYWIGVDEGKNPSAPRQRQVA
jgi:hypothetical protein